MGGFEYRQALEIRDVFARHEVRYLFIGKSGAILLGYPDTTQDADLFVERSPANGRAIVAALRDLAFPLTEAEAVEIERGKDFVQIRSGPFDVDLVFAPDGIERFADAWSRRIDIDGFPVPSRRHHRQQGRRQSRQRSREPPAAARIPRVLARPAEGTMTGTLASERIEQLRRER